MQGILKKNSNGGPENNSGKCGLLEEVGEKAETLNGFYFEFTPAFQSFEMQQQERSFFVLKLQNFVQVEQLEDPDEKDQIFGFQDLKFQKFIKT